MGRFPTVLFRPKKERQKVIVAVRPVAAGHPTDEPPRGERIAAGEIRVEGVGETVAAIGEAHPRVIVVSTGVKAAALPDAEAQTRLALARRLRRPPVTRKVRPARDELPAVGCVGGAPRPGGADVDTVTRGPKPPLRDRRAPVGRVAVQGPRAPALVLDRGPAPDVVYQHSRQCTVHELQLLAHHVEAISITFWERPLKVMDSERAESPGETTAPKKGSGAV